MDRNDTLPSKAELKAMIKQQSMPPDQAKHQTLRHEPNPRMIQASERGIEYSTLAYWSGLSASIEYDLRHFIAGNEINNVDTDPAHESTYDFFPNLTALGHLALKDSPKVPVVETFTTYGDDEDSENKMRENDSLVRIYSTWRHFTRDFILNRETFTSNIVDKIVADVVTNFTPDSSVSKQKAFVKQSIQETQLQNENYHKQQRHEQKQSQVEGSTVKMRGMLKARTVDGRIHLRPLCTSSDILLATQELMDSTRYLQGCIQLPDLLKDTCTRITGSYYRYIYRLNGPGQFLHLRMSLPSHLKVLKPYVCPVMCPSLFTAKPLKDPDQSLVEMSEMIRDILLQYYGDENLLTDMVLDFEACRERIPKDEQVTEAIIASTAAALASALLAGKVAPLNELTSNATKGTTEGRKHYRLLQISKTHFVKRIAAFRRDEILKLGGFEKEHLHTFAQALSKEKLRMSKSLKEMLYHNNINSQGKDDMLRITRDGSREENFGDEGSSSEAWQEFGHDEEANELDPNALFMHFLAKKFAAASLNDFAPSSFESDSESDANVDKLQGMKQSSGSWNDSVSFHAMNRLRDDHIIGDNDDGEYAGINKEGGNITMNDKYSLKTQKFKRSLNGDADSKVEYFNDSSDEDNDDDSRDLHANENPEHAGLDDNISTPPISPTSPSTTEKTRTPVVGDKGQLNKVRVPPPLIILLLLRKKPLESKTSISPCS